MSDVVCATCEKREYDCGCDRYCCICMGQYDIHLCTDGLYYCPDCREACEATLAEQRERG